MNRVVEQSEKITPLRLTPLFINDVLDTILKMQKYFLNTQLEIKINLHYPHN
ncbi:hypothetical protein HMPREF0653_02091 [Prevotella disiens JCM 6334 = ATCC 29426]|uniref:Uncharacterized protein n=1 Tax=Prevotella disiens JCM 6334 = ATCC 29426 TaxID=1235811 RepID=A0ABN0NQ89_9BACT|nr:hypothetical protein HMPREF0653_02091 [Prevotella disiens JCM 6334 = ATCC 29426]